MIKTTQSSYIRSRLTIRPRFGGHVLIFNKTKKMFTGNAKKCPNVLLFDIINRENMSNHSFTKKVWEVSVFFWSSLEFGRKIRHLRTSLF